MKTTTDFQLVATDKLIPYVNNARTHSPEQIKKLRSSLREFGFVNPVIIDREYNVIAGHGRLMAAKEEGITEVPCVYVDHLTDAQKKAYILADNRMAMDAGWDEELLAVEMSELQEMGYDLSMTGFDEKELAALFASDEDAKQDDFDVDGELEKPCFSKPEDVWHLGRHIVICDDSTLPETYTSLLGDTKVNLVCTDPPYLVNLESKSGKIKNDDLDDEQGYKFLRSAFERFRDAMAKDASIYVFYATAKARVFHDAYEDAGFKVGAGLVWKKDRLVLTRTDWKYIHEPIIWGWRKDGKHIWYGDQKQKTVFEFDRIKNSKEDGCGHPSSKPVPLITSTLRAEAHHPPCVMEAAGFCTEHSAKARSIGYEEETAPTLRAGVVPAALLFENHSQDTRYTGPLDTAPTVSATYGMGGNNQPFVVDTPKVYGICSKKSNSMLSDNPHSGFYEAETTRTLDTSGSDPSCAQGGMVVVEGNGSRPSHHGDGYAESDTMYTLNTVEVPAVAYGIERAAFNMGQNAKYGMAITEDVQPTMVAKGAGAVAQPVYTTNKSTFHTAAETDVAGTLVATDYKDPPTVTEEPYYIVRRLLPQECARLQGFPSWWCDDLGTDNPTDAEIDRWADIFEPFRKATGSSAKPKSRSMIAKWLKNPYSDSAAYRLWGNGVCLNAVFYVLSGIAYYAQTEST